MRCRFFRVILSENLLAIFLLILIPHSALADKHPQIPVILISVDTLRADHLGCYGYKALETRSIDGFTQGGTLFKQVTAQVPLTFPSHVSMLTSTFPFGNAVIENGEELRPGAVTIAVILKRNGYRTAGFVGGFVLDRRFGLDQGFDFYDSAFDPNDEEGRTDPGDIKCPGEEVVEKAKRWVEANSSGPFFLFLHLYDLHTPYNSSPDFRKRFGYGYNAELAYVDQVLGGFCKFVVTSGLMEKSLIIFTADHGESLGEHGETTHGYFIYQSTLRVPLIIHWPEEFHEFPSQVSDPVSLMDVAPTILQYLGIGRPAEFQGQSLLGLLDKHQQSSDRDVYSESRYAHDHFGAGTLRSLRVGKYKLIEAAKPELFDLQRDPNETNNLYGRQNALASAFHQDLISLLARYKPDGNVISRTPDPETVAKLRSLGYVALSGSHPASLDSGPDPKDLLPDYETFGRAAFMASSGSVPEANALLRQLLKKNPDLVDVRISLGLNEQRLGNQHSAVELFTEALKRDPLNVVAIFDLGVSQLALGNSDAAAREFESTLTLAPYYTRSEELLGTILLAKKEYQNAQAHFMHVLTISPNSYRSNYNLGILAAENRQRDLAWQYLQVAVKAEPRSAEAHNALGSLCLLKKQLNQAQDEFNAAIRLNPRFASAHYNLGLVFRDQQKFGNAAQEFRLALSADPGFDAARSALSQLPSLN